MVQGLFSRETDPLIIDILAAWQRPVISYGTCEECRRKYSFFCFVTLKIISGQETPVTLPG